MTAMQNMQCAIAALDTRTKNFDKLHGEVQNLQASLAALSNRIYALEQNIKGTVNEQYIVMFGNPSDGFEYVGPFPSGNEASEYADRHLSRGGDWWIVMLQKPLP